MNKNKITGQSFNAGRFFVVLLVFVMLAAFSPLGSALKPAEVNAADATVSDWTSFKDAIDAANADEEGGTITVDGTFGVIESLKISKNITVNGSGTLRRHHEMVGPMFEVQDQGELTLGGSLILSGKNSAGGNHTYRRDNDANKLNRGFFVEVNEGGKLVIDGATLQDYNSFVPSSKEERRLTIEGVSPVYVKGDFEMRSGSITKNETGASPIPPPRQRLNPGTVFSYVKNNSGLKAINPETGEEDYADLNGWRYVMANGKPYTVVRTNAGAIFFEGEGERLITGGTISDNKGHAGAIAVASGKLVIKNNPNDPSASPQITNNWGDHFGTVYITGENSRVDMCGGVIGSNTNAHGGGILATNDGSFFLMGGTIDGNANFQNGGGVLIYSDHVYLLSGQITNNISAVFGGGIYVYGDDELPQYQYTTVLHTAQITGNKALSDQRFNSEVPQDKRSNDIGGAKTDDAFLQGSGGGVWLCPAGTVEFDAGSINLYDNEATNQGKDFHKDAGYFGGVLLDFGPHAQLAKKDGEEGDWKHDEINHPKGDVNQSLTVAEATSGEAGRLSLYNDKKRENVQNPQLYISGNISRRGGGVGSNGSVLFIEPTDIRDRNVDKGKLSYKKTFVDMDPEPMEFEMLLADDKGEPVLDADKNEIPIAIFRLYDEEWASHYEENRKKSDTPVSNQLEAKWNDDYSEISLKFPSGMNGINFFTPEGDTADLNMVVNEYRVNDDGNRGKKVGERFFRSDGAEFTGEEDELTKTIAVYNPTGNADCANGGQNCACDPGEPQTFSFRYRNFNFKSAGVNQETPEIEKYVNEAVHSDIKVDDEFTYNILAYVSTDADEMVITDELDDQLEFVSSASDVKLYDLGVDEDGNPLNNHLPAYDTKGKAIDNGGKTPSVQTGTAIKIKNNKYSKVMVEGSMLTVKLANKLVDDGSGQLINADDDQELTPYRGHYVRVEFKARLAKSVRQKINKTNTDEGIAYETIKDDQEYKDGIHGERGTPYTGNDPVKSDENHTGIANTASYEMKVNNTAKYQDTSNTVTVKPEVPGKPEIEKYVNKAVHKDVDYEEVFTYDIIAFVTRDADYVHISDILSDVLEYVSKSSEVKVADLGEDVNHKVANDIYAEQVNADASVAAKGTAIKDAKVSINGKELTVDIPKAAKYRGHWIRVSFDARIIPSSLQSDILNAYDDVYADLVYKDSVTKGKRSMDNVGNAPVISDEDHDGIPNTASYMIKVGGLYKYGDTSNTVTVKPTDINDYVLDESENKKDEESKIKGADTGDDAPLGFALAGLLGSALAIELMRRRRMS